MTPPVDETLNLKQVAAQLGVHYMTAYRYVRQGQLPARRDGTNWRVDAADLARFERRRVARPNGSVDEEPVDWAARTAAALLAHDEVTAWRLIDRALAAGHDPAFCFIDMIGAALVEIDARSEVDDLGPSTWPAVTVLAERLVARLGARFRRPGRNRGCVVIGGPTGERHQIPISILADLIRLAGFDVIELGADASPGTFADAAGRAPQLRAVGIGVTTVQQLEAARAAITKVRAVAPNTPILVGGQAVRNEDVARLLDADEWAADARSAVAIIEQLTDHGQSGTRSERSTGAGSGAGSTMPADGRTV